MSSGSVPSPSAAEHVWPGRARGRSLLRDRDELRRSAETVVEVVGQLLVAAVLDQRLELAAGHARRDVVVAGRTEHAVDVAVDLVRPAHVLREQAARDHVVADHGLGGHVTHERVREADPVLHQRLDVLHVVALDGVGPRLVEHDDQHPRRPVGPHRGRPGITPASTAEPTNARITRRRHLMSSLLDGAGRRRRHRRGHAPRSLRGFSSTQRPRVNRLAPPSDSCRRLTADPPTGGRGSPALQASSIA